MRVPSIAGLVPAADPVVTRPASLLGAEAAAQRGWLARFGGPNGCTNVVSCWLALSKPSATATGVGQAPHEVVRKTWESEFDNGSWVPATPCGRPRIGGTPATPNVPIRTSMSNPCAGETPGP